jgi:hypothetical protein
MFPLEPSFSSVGSRPETGGLEVERAYVHD